MTISDIRNVNYKTDKFRALLTPTYPSLFARLFLGRENAINVVGNDYESVGVRYNVIDDGSATPTIRAEETNTVNHYKFVGGKEKFNPVLRDGIISVKSGTSDMTALSNAALRLETINFDSDMLLGADGNKGILVSSVGDALRLTVDGAVLALPAKTASFEARANAVQALGAAFRKVIDSSSMAASGYVLIYGSSLKEYLSAKNTATDNATLLGYFRDGLDLPMAMIKIQDRLIEGSTLTNGISFLDANGFDADVCGESKLPYITVGAPEKRDSFEYDVVRVSRGSVQIKPTVEGGIITAVVTIAS